MDQGYLKSLDAPEDMYDLAMRSLNSTMMDLLKIENCSLSKQLDAVSAYFKLKYVNLFLTLPFLSKCRPQKALDSRSSSSLKQSLNCLLLQSGPFSSLPCFYHWVLAPRLAYSRECSVLFSTLIFLRGLASHMLPVCSKSNQFYRYTRKMIMH